jgi:glycosyltransferase involved in cell wall biosynthesis
MSAHVSVIVPCFNQGAFLDEALDSVEAQTHGDWEIVVVDDASTDSVTRERLATLRRPRTTVVRSEVNRGLPGARNLGLAHTRGPFVCALDADDVLAPTLFEKSLAALEADSSLAFASHWVRRFGAENWDWKPERCDLATLLDLNTVNGAALVRRSALDAVGGWDESFRSGCEDWDLWISLVERGMGGTILPEILFFYRRHPAAMSETAMSSAVQLAQYERILRKHADPVGRYFTTLAARRHESLEHLAGELEALEREHERWMPELLDLQEQVFALRAKLGREKNDPLRAANEQIVALGERLRHALGATQEAELRVATLERALRDRDQQIEEHAAEAEQRVATLERALRDRDQQIADHTAEAEQRVATLERALRDRDQQIAEHTAEAERLRAHHQSALERNVALEAGQWNLRREIDALRRSRSWQLTSPLRRAANALLRGPKGDE